MYFNSRRKLEEEFAESVKKLDAHHIKQSVNSGGYFSETWAHLLHVSTEKKRLHVPATHYWRQFPDTRQMHTSVFKLNYAFKIHYFNKESSNGAECMLEGGRTFENVIIPQLNQLSVNKKKSISDLVTLKNR